MSLKKHISKGLIFEYATNKNEIDKMLRIANRDIKEASENCHEIDWQFAIAYNAALQLATAVLRASGHRASTKVGHHWVTFTMIPEILGDDFTKVANYFNECRVKRNITEYCEMGTISEKEAEKLIHEVKAFKAKVISWLKTNYDQKPVS